MILPYKRGTVRVTSPYGNRTIDGELELHKGIDLVGTDKTVVAVKSGVVGWAGLYDDSASGGRTHEWGNYVRIDAGDGYSFYYCHLAEVSVRMGRYVYAGEIVGVEGNTGDVWPKPVSSEDKTSGRHLHFEVRYVGRSTDPTPYLGIANRAGTYPVIAENAESIAENADFAGLVCEKCGFEPQTREYLDNYKYSTDLWRKLWKAMEGNHE